MPANQPQPGPTGRTTTSNFSYGASWWGFGARRARRCPHNPKVAGSNPAATTLGRPPVGPRSALRPEPALLAAGTHVTSATAFPETRGQTGASPQSKTIPTGHNPSQGARRTRSGGTPRPARDYGVWRAKEMVDRGRIELPTPGFSVPCSRLLRNPLTHPGVKLGAGGSAPGRRSTAPWSAPIKRGAATAPSSTLPAPEAGRVGAGPTSLRISLRYPIIRQLTPSHSIPEDPGRQRREAHTSAGVVAVEVARLEGIEPPTHGLEGRCSIRLSYRRVQKFLATCGALVKRSGRTVPGTVPGALNRSRFVTRRRQDPRRPAGRESARGTS